jgi:acyl-CoA hydrolase
VATHLHVVLHASIFGGKVVAAMVPIAQIATFATGAEIL